MATVKEVELAVHELQLAGVIAVADVPVRIEWGCGIMENDLAGDVRIVVPAASAVVSSGSLS